MNVKEIALLVGGDIAGNPEATVRRLAKIEEASSGDLAFLANSKYERFLASTRATAVLIARSQRTDHAQNTETTFIRVNDPYFAFMQCVPKFIPAKPPFHDPPGIHPTACVDPTVVLGENVSIGPFVSIGANTKIGSHTQIQAGARIDSNVILGDHCVVHPNVVIFQQTVVGSRCVFQPGCVIGMDGFGFAKDREGRYQKILQAGNVIIHDDVEIGPNDTIARSALGSTVIERGTKLDGLVHVAHHCHIGENCAFAAQVGLAGSTKVGRNCSFAGQSGATGHLELADGAVVLAQTAVTKSHRKSGITLLGSPGREHRESLRQLAANAKAPELLEEVRALRKEIESLRARISSNGS